MVGDPMVSASPGVLGGVSDCLSFRHGISRRTSILVRGHCAVERYERLRKTAGIPPFLGWSHAASDSPNREFLDSTVDQVSPSAGKNNVNSRMSAHRCLHDCTR